jgi:hypothetical protein
VLDELLEPALVAAAVDLLGQGRALQGERHLSGKGLDCQRRLHREEAGRGDHQRPAQRTLAPQRHGQHVEPLDLLAIIVPCRGEVHRGGGSRERQAVRDSHLGAEGVIAAVAVGGDYDEDAGLVLGHAAAGTRIAGDEVGEGVDGGLVDLAPGGGGDERHPRLAQDPLPRRLALLGPHEAPQPPQHEHGHGHRPGGEHADSVAVPSQDLDRQQPGDEQQRGAQQAEPASAQPRLTEGRRVGDLGHRRMQGGGGEDHVAEGRGDHHPRPSHSVDLVHVRQRVRHQNGHDPGGDEVVAGRPPPGSDGQPHHHGDEDEVQERVGHGQDLVQPAPVGMADVGVQEIGGDDDPHRGGDDRRVEHAVVLAARRPSPHEGRRSRDEHAVAQEEEGVGHGREGLRLFATGGVAGQDRAAQQEGEGAREEGPPARRRCRTPAPDAHGDRHQRDGTDQRADGVLGATRKGSGNGQRGERNGDEPPARQAARRRASCSPQREVHPPLVT